MFLRILEAMLIVMFVATALWARNLGRRLDEDARRLRDIFE